MSTLSDLLAEHTDLTGAAAGHLQRVVAEWQLLADLSFADLLMYVRSETERVICVAQSRPNTASTVYPADEVGGHLDGDWSVRQGFSSSTILHDQEPAWLGQTAVRREAVPVVYANRVVAVVSRTANLAQVRLPSSLELAYRHCADELCQMMADGTFPQYDGNPRGLSTPRAGDGFIRLDDAGEVVFASPNALSAVHRMGWTAELTGNRLSVVVAELLTDRFVADDVVAMIDDAVGGRTGTRIEADARRASVLIRTVPLRPRGRPAGAAVLLRDVTELKRRDRALISKDATIREIHHRVKNNLQSVSALLRLQARRTDNAEARAALTEAVRRVAAIALVHELLSGSVDEEVDLDVVADQLVPVMTDVAAGGNSATVRREGSLGVLPSDLATPMVMVLTELIQNALEHAFPTAVDGEAIDGEAVDREAAVDAGAPAAGEVVIDAQRSTRRLVVTVRDDGIGLPAGFDPTVSDRLGLQIVQTLVRIELGGSLTMTTAANGGTVAIVTVPLR